MFSYYIISTKYKWSTEFEKLDEIRVEEIKKPFIIKPFTGFFSLGVYKVSANGEWDLILRRIKSEVEEIKSHYPVQVLDAGKFIIEENIEGGRSIYMPIDAAVNLIDDAEEDVYDTITVRAKSESHWS